MTDERNNLPSASASDTWMRCQGQPAMVRSLPPREASGEAHVDEAASRGTKLHAALETGNTLDLDEAEVVAYKQAVHNRDDAIEQWQRDLGIELATEGERELRLWLWDQNGKEPIVSGKSDAHWIESGTRTPCVMIQDYKSGSGIGAGKASENSQLRTLAVLMRYEYGARHVRVILNKFESFGQQLDYCDYDEAALNQAEYMVRFHLWLTTLPNAPRTPGTQCYYCAAVGTCPENAAYAMLPAAIAQSATGALERIDALTPADLKAIWNRDTDVRKILDRVSYRLSTLPDETLAEIGLKKGRPKETEKIVDVAGAIARLRESGLSDADLLQCMSVGREKLTQLVRREFGLKSDDKASQWLQQRIGDCVETKTSSGGLKEIKH